MMAIEKYQQPMEPWPSLAPLGNTVKLSEKNINLFYYSAGNKNNPTILMIHGLGDEADTWRHVIHPLANEYHIVAIDLPGFGRSDKPKRSYTPQFMKETILKLMDKLAIKEAILMGSSLGGILSQSLAVDYPDLFQGLILVDGALLQKEPMQDLGLRLMQVPLLGEWLYNRLRKDPDAAFESLKVVYQDLDNLPDADKDFLYTRVNKRVWSDGQRRAYFSTLRNLMPWVKKAQNSLPAKLAELEIPTLVIRGEYDKLFPQENAKAIIKAQPNAAMTTITDTNHLPHQEDPVAFVDVVRSWLKVNF